jgi:hypothetical protein
MKFWVKVNTAHEVEEAGPAPFRQVPYMRLVNRVALWEGSPNAPATDCVEACLYADSVEQAVDAALDYLDTQVAMGLALAPS